jgi:phosphoribosyl-AMP cyclohydrolase
MMQSANRRLRKLAFARRRSVEEIEEGEVLALRFDGRGLNLVVATDADSGEVLMMGVINAEALVRTIATGEAHYWSRSCKELWRKGATSGLVQRVVEVRIDDDQDAIWLRVEVTGLGGSCHVGYHSCFYRAVPIERWAMAPRICASSKRKSCSIPGISMPMHRTQHDSEAPRYGYCPRP